MIIRKYCDHRYFEGRLKIMTNNLNQTKVGQRIINGEIYSLSLEKYRMIRNIFVLSPRIEWLFMSEGCSMEYQGPSFFCKILLNAFPNLWNLIISI